MTEEQQEKIKSLLLRAGVSQNTISEICDDQSLCIALEVVSDLFVDRKSPDKNWWREIFDITGEPMVLTEEGWEECQT